MIPQENTVQIHYNGRKLSDAWARVRVAQVDPETGEPALDENGKVITHWFSNKDIPFDANSPAGKGMIALAKENPDKVFLATLTVNVPDPEAKRNEEPLLDL